MAVLTGKIALITGASRGIGRATARALSEVGAAVYLAADGSIDLSDQGNGARTREGQDQLMRSEM